MTAARKLDPTWRNSYDINDPRAQVSTVHWEVTADKRDAFAFFDVFKKSVWDYSAHIRGKGKQMPICANAERVLRALIGFMDFKTGRCDPTLDSIAAASKLSRRTVVRQLQVLRERCGIEWVRRTVRTGNAPGYGPQRKQTSNSYFIDLAKVPVEIMRALRQKLGDRLKEARARRPGSGSVPNRMMSKIAGLAYSVAGALGAQSAGIAERRRLAGATDQERFTHMYRDDPEGLREHRAMLRSGESASAKSAFYPPSRTEEEKD